MDNRSIPEQGPSTSNNLRLLDSNLSYKEYHNRVELAIGSLQTSWSTPHRVEVLQEIIQLIESTRRDDHKFDACKLVLESIRSNFKFTSPEDSVIEDKSHVNYILKLFSLLNDSMTPLAMLEDLEHLSRLCIFIINRISTEDHMERFNFYSRCRSILSNLNPTMEFLVRETLKLVEDFSKKFEKKRKLRQNFTNGCLAFALITIPAVSNLQTRLDLLIEGATLALEKTSLSLADHYFKQISLLLKQSQQMTKEVQMSFLLRVMNLIHKHESEVDLKHKLMFRTTNMNFSDGDMSPP